MLCGRAVDFMNGLDRSSNDSTSSLIDRLRSSGLLSGFFSFRYCLISALDCVMGASALVTDEVVDMCDKRDTEGVSVTQGAGKSMGALLECTARPGMMRVSVYNFSSLDPLQLSLFPADGVGHEAFSVPGFWITDDLLIKFFPAVFFACIGIDKLLPCE